MNEQPKPITITSPVTITVDGKEVVAQKGDLLIDAAQRAGTYIPRFCYHPRMSSVGMCRMCLVEVDTGRGMSLQPSCMIECTDGMAVDTASDTVRKAQDGVLEFLLINHPLDCPVCDKGGECPLQDQTMAFGPGESRWVEEKRHYTKPIAISETVYLDRERCILCDRCTRFADEVAGDPLIHFMDRGSATQVNTFPGEPFSSYFSGNVVEICPVGALTAKPYRFRARPWDLEQVESTCTGCSVGCRITVQSSHDEVLRYQGVDSDPVNWGWLCDKGRFGFEAVNSEGRVAAPMMSVGGELRPAGWSDALGAAADALRGDPSRIGVIGGARLTNESAYAWAKLVKGVVGTDHVDAQLGDGLPAEVVASLPRATIDDACRPGGTVIYLGPDPKEELGVLFIRLKHAVTNDGVKLIELTPAATGLTRYATVSLNYRPGEAALMVDSLLAGDDGGGADGEGFREAVELLADDVTVVLGRPTVSEAAGTIVDAAAAILAAKPTTRFLSALRRSNIHGAIDLGLAPGLLPGRVSLDAGRSTFATEWPSVPRTSGLDTAGILTAAAEGRIDTLVLLGADPLTDFADRALAERAIAGSRTIVAITPFLDASARKADIVLAAAGFAEVAGTTTNLEGRVSVLNQKVTPPGTARPDWLIASELAHRLGAELGAASAAEIWSEIERLSVVHAGVTAAMLGASENADGVVVPLVPATATFVSPARTELAKVDAHSYRLVATRSMYDQGTLLQHCDSSKGLARGAVAAMSPSSLATLGVAPGESVRLTSGDRSLVITTVSDPGVPAGVVVVPINHSDLTPATLIDSMATVCEVRVEVVS